MSSSHGFRRVLRTFARPVKSDKGEGGVIIQPYRGYGSQREVFLIGRVFRQLRGGSGMREGSVSRDVLDLGRRFLRWGTKNAVLRARFNGQEMRVETDTDGYFRVHMDLEKPPPDNGVWHEMHLDLLEPYETKPGAHIVAEVYVPPRSARFVVISDIDDTVMFTGVANKIMMFYRLFAQGAEDRVAFPGAAAFYRALYHGSTETSEGNPMLYVSRGPWSIYDVLERFFQNHEIPEGPLLFLREWGLTLQSPMPRKAESHKHDLICNMLSLYKDLPFVLIGDSGQHDPEVYARVVRENPDRILAIYIRNVSKSAERPEAIQQLAKEVVDQGSSLVLAADSFAMAEHAAEHELISREALGEVLREREEEREAEDPETEPTRKIVESEGEQARRDAETGEIKRELEEETEAGTPRNVSIEAEQDKTRERKEEGRRK